jgi:hypothetical protein
MKTEDTDGTTAICLSCHARGKVAANEKLEGYTHPVGVSLPEATTSTRLDQGQVMIQEDGNPDLPLLNDLGMSDKKGKITCATCHDTHGGSLPDEPSAVGDATPGLKIKNTLLRKQSPELCRQCHGDKFAIEHTEHDFNFKFPEGSTILEQKVPESDLCQNCHRIHSHDPDGFVWARNIVTTEGRHVYDKCTGCHAKGGLAPEKTVHEHSHPVNVSLTNTMNETILPLFNASGNKTGDGIMTCYTCHDAHHRSSVASEKGNSESIGSRPVPRFLRIDISPGSDLCINCHSDKADILRTDHNLVLASPGAKNSTGRTPDESGACGACHLVHNSRQPTEIWARDPGPGNNMMDRLCNSCHWENGPAASKVPKVSTHPDTLIISRQAPAGGKIQGFPLFDKTTGNPVNVGNMSCPSCHDAHHWDGDTVTTGVYINIEGNAETSFLRPHVPDQICKQCHGFEGLFVYKYFHRVDVRKQRTVISGQ